MKDKFLKERINNIEKVKILLDYSPKYDVRAGLEKSIQWYIRNTVI